MHVSVFNSNLPIHTYPDSLLVRQLICKATLRLMRKLYRQSSAITVSLTTLSYQALFRSFNLFTASNLSVQHGIIEAYSNHS